MKTNCINCGAPLKNRKCEYCGTEYTLDNFGQINEYKIKLNIMGREKDFYISEIISEPIINTSERNMNGYLIQKEIDRKLKLELIEM